MKHDLVIQQADAASAQAGRAELMLLFHGVGSNAQDLQALAEVLAESKPGAWVVSVQAPHAFEFGNGWQWFSVQGVTEANRPARVAEAMPEFLVRVRAWQARTGSTAERTTLIGFSQGSIMSLESTQEPGAALAKRVIAIAGRFAQPPRQVPLVTHVNLLHGEQDAVMPLALAVAAEQQLRALGTSVSLDRFSGLGHGIDRRVAETVVRQLV